jgi:hypothetical protein
MSTPIPPFLLIGNCSDNELNFPFYCCFLTQSCNNAYLAATETEAEAKRERKRRAAEAERERERKRRAKEKYDRIYNACVLSESDGRDMQARMVQKAIHKTCDDIAEDPSWLDKLRYD